MTDETSARSSNPCKHEIGPWPSGQQWPRCLKCEIEDLRQFKQWAEPQCQDYAANRMEIERAQRIMSRAMSWLQIKEAAFATHKGAAIIEEMQRFLTGAADETCEAPEKCGGKCPRHGPYVLLGRKGPCPICEEIKQRASEKASGCPTHGMEHFFEGMCIKCGVVPAQNGGGSPT